MQFSRRFATALAVLTMSVAVAVPSAVAGDKTASSVTIVNNSGYDIYHLFLSSVDEKKWGPDQLGEETIDAEGGTFRLKGVPCDDYDVRLIDEDGDECLVAAVDICAEDAVWNITSDDLLSCQGFGVNESDDEP